MTGRTGTPPGSSALDGLPRGGAPTAYEYVRGTLRAALLDGTLAGGTRLLQTELAQQLGVSTTPVREALRDLATEGLVVLDARRGALVRSLDVDEVRELYDLRMTLEPMLVRRVVPLVTTDQLDRATRLHREMGRPLDVVGGTAAWSELNRRFHATLSEPAEGSRLASILAGLRDGAAPFVALSLSARPHQVAESNDEHGRLVQLYRDGLVEEAVHLTVRHLAATVRAIEDAHEHGAL